VSQTTVLVLLDSIPLIVSTTRYRQDVFENRNRAGISKILVKDLWVSRCPNRVAVRIFEYFLPGPSSMRFGIIHSHFALLISIGILVIQISTNLTLMHETNFPTVLTPQEIVPIESAAMLFGSQ